MPTKYNFATVQEEKRTELEAKKAFQSGQQVQIEEAQQFIIPLQDRIRDIIKDYTRSRCFLFSLGIPVPIDVSYGFNVYSILSEIKWYNNWIEISLRRDPNAKEWTIIFVHRKRSATNSTEIYDVLRTQFASYKITGSDSNQRTNRSSTTNSALDMSVVQFFQVYEPSLLMWLHKTTGHWPRMKNNTITNEELAKIVMKQDTESALYQVASLILSARTMGLVSNKHRHGARNQ